MWRSISLGRGERKGTAGRGFAEVDIATESIVVSNVTFSGIPCTIDMNPHPA
jgi:hypothetical protein